MSICKLSSSRLGFLLGVAGQHRYFCNLDKASSFDKSIFRYTFLCIGNVISLGDSTPIIEYRKHRKHLYKSVNSGVNPDFIVIIDWITVAALVISTRQDCIASRFSARNKVTNRSRYFCLSVLKVNCSIIICLALRIRGTKLFALI